VRLLLLILFSAVHTVSVWAQEFELDTLVFHGESEKRINLVILGDGYLDSQLATFAADARDLAAKFLDTSPFREYQNQFNIFAIPVASNEEGAGYSPGVVDNYYGSVFNYGGIPRLLVPAYTHKVMDVLASAFPMYDQILMIVNSETYGGSGGTIATCSKNQLSGEIALHEIGHSFGGLADEYFISDQNGWEAANMTKQSSPGRIKWKNWLNDNGIGIVLHSGSSVWYKPSYNTCKMEALNKSFCSVCAEQIVRTIHQMSSPVDRYRHTVTGDEIQFELTLIQPHDYTLKIKWFVNGVRMRSNTEYLSVTQSDLGSGENEITALVYDSTYFDRRNDYYLTTVMWTLDGNVYDKINKTLVDKPDWNPVTSISEPEVGKTSIRVYPNPVNSILLLEYSLDRQTKVTTSVRNAEGKVIARRVDKKPAGNHTQQLDLSSFSNGMYLVDIDLGNIHTQHRVMKED